MIRKIYFLVYLVSEHYISKINIGPLCTISHPTVAPTRNTNSEKREEEKEWISQASLAQWAKSIFEVQMNYRKVVSRSESPLVALFN